MGYKPYSMPIASQIYLAARAESWAREKTRKVAKLLACKSFRRRKPTSRTTYFTCYRAEKVLKTIRRRYGYMMFRTAVTRQDSDLMAAPTLYRTTRSMTCKAGIKVIQAAYPARASA